MSMFFNVRHTLKKYFSFLGSKSYAYEFNLLSLSDVLLQTVKYQPHNPGYIFLMLFPHRFNLDATSVDVLTILAL